MDLEYINMFLMIKFTKENGKMRSSMVKEYSNGEIN